MEETETEWSTLLQAARAARGDAEQLVKVFESLVKRQALSLCDNRTALRVALCCLDATTLSVSVRRDMQITAYSHWIQGLLESILQNKDPKIQQLAAQVSCNIVTDNTVTSRDLYNSVPLEPSNDNKKNWVDLVLQTRHNRLAVAAVVACYYNMAVQQNSMAVDSCRLWTATLCRQLVTAQSMQQALSSNANKNDTKVPQQQQQQTNSGVDEATEWIGRVLLWQCHMYSLEQLYHSLSSSSTIVPEQVVLLHVVRSDVEASEHQQKWDTLPRVSDGLFLVNLHLLQHSNGTMKESDDALKESVQQLSLDILGEVLSQHNEPLSKLKVAIGETTILMQQLCVELADILDAWMDTNEQKSAREQIQLSDSHSSKATSIVRLIGNLCHGNAGHQDALRLVSVPRGKAQRCGLHVLLSMTSMSFACFTLREWAIVAIRAALEGSEANQKVVEQLEATSAVQSAELDNMGIRVDLNAANGNVSVHPIDKVDKSP